MKKLMLLTMLFGLMIAFTGSASAQENCGEPGDYEVIIYEHIFNQAGGGICKKLGVGDYGDSSKMGLADNIMSSIKVGKKVYAMVCDGQNFTGACELFDKNDADLRNNPTIKNDIVSSVRVIKTKMDGAGADKICPENAGAKVNIKWTNNTNKTLRINWVNNGCKEEKNDREIKPGQVYDGISYVGHVFVVRDFTNNEQLGHIIVTASNGTQVLK